MNYLNLPWLLEMSLVVALLMAPAVLYLSFRFYFVISQQFTEHSLLGYLLLGVLLSFYLFPLAGLLDFYIRGDVEILRYPKLVIYWFWFGLVFVYQLTTWILIADISKILTQFTSWDKNQITRVHAKTLVSLFIMIFCFTGWKVYHDTTHIETQKISLSVEDLPESLHNFKIVHISDIQGDRYTGAKDISRYIKQVNTLNPDLVIFTGDLISYGTDYIKQSAIEFGKTNARFGTVAVVGDHDYWAGVQYVEKALNKEGIVLLQDENQTIEIDSTTNISITGVTEVYSKSSDPGMVDSLTSSTANSELKIFASHQVDDHLISSSQKNNYHLLLAGHTHGGQIRVPFMGMNFSASERETGYVSGLYREGNLPINVNNGLGFTLAPIRYDAPPNVSVITLKGNEPM